jgi:hypothetical protein
MDESAGVGVGAGGGEGDGDWTTAGFCMGISGELSIAA